MDFLKESLIAIGSFTALCLGVEMVTDQTRMETVTITGRSGPEIHGAQRILETDKGPLALTGMTWYVDDKQGAGDASLINQFKVGTTYCMELHNNGLFGDAVLEKISASEHPEWQVYGGKTKIGPTCDIP